MFPGTRGYSTLNPLPYPPWSAACRAHQAQFWQRVCYLRLVRFPATPCPPSYLTSFLPGVFRPLTHSLRPLATHGQLSFATLSLSLTSVTAVVTKSLSLFLTGPVQNFLSNSIKSPRRSLPESVLPVWGERPRRRASPMWTAVQGPGRSWPAEAARWGGLLQGRV